MFKLKTFTMSLSLLIASNMAIAEPIQYLPKITDLPSYLGEKEKLSITIPEDSDMGKEIVMMNDIYKKIYNTKKIKKDDVNYYILSLNTYGTPKNLKLKESSAKYSVNYLTEYGFVYAMQIETEPKYDEIYIKNSYETFKKLLLDTGYSSYPVASKIIDGNFTNKWMNGESFTKDGTIISLDTQYKSGKGDQIIITATTRENKDKYTKNNKEIYMKRQEELKEKEAKEFAKKMF